MKKVSFILIFMLCLLIVKTGAQENAKIPPRTPEQEAVAQTNKMQQDLQLSAEQAQSVYEINLRHARERQLSSSRSDALKRVRNKELELQRVLNNRQYERMQEMRYNQQPAGNNTDTQITGGRTHPVTNPQTIQKSRTVNSSQAANSENTGDRMRNLPPSRNVQPSRENTPPSRNVQPTRENNQQRSAQPAREGTRYVPDRRNTQPASARPSSGNERPSSSGSRR
jgi:hypothetical protein